MEVGHACFFHWGVRLDRLRPCSRAQRKARVMRRGAVSTFQRWQFRDGRPNRSARVLSRLLGIAFAAGIGPNQGGTIRVRSPKTRRRILFPIVGRGYGGERYLVAML